MSRHAHPLPEALAGFSLVELLVALVFTLLLMAGMATVFRSSLSTAVRTSDQLSNARRNQMSMDTQYFDMGLMAMGKLPVVKISQNALSPISNFRAPLPDLWAAKATGHYLQGGVVDFVHSKEAWVSTPSRLVTRN